MSATTASAGPMAAQAPANQDNTDSAISYNCRAKEVKFVRPHRDDRIFKMALDHLVMHNRQSLEHFTDPMRLEALDRVPTSFTPKESNTVQLALVYGESAFIDSYKLVRGSVLNPRIDTLMVGGNSGWCKLKVWLASLPAPGGHIPRDRHKHEELFQRWLSKNGKAFRLLDLPAELRENVYRHLFPSDVYPLRVDEGKKKFGMGHHSTMVNYRDRGLDHTWKQVEAPQRGILCANRQLNAECEDFLWKETTKCFLDHRYFSEFLTYTLDDPTKYNKLRYLELNLSHYDYINLFKVNVIPFRDTDRHGLDALTDTLPTLVHVQEFTLRFTSPFDSMQYDPWGYTGEINGFNWYQDWNGNRDRDGFSTSCQKTLVDLILTYAMDYIKHFPKVFLTGAIKNSTKLKFDLLLTEERKGISHDLTAEKQAIASTTVLPPPCHCTTPCENKWYRSTCHRENAAWECKCYVCYHMKYREMKEEQRKLEAWRFDFED